MYGFKLNSKFEKFPIKLKKYGMIFVCKQFI